MMIALFVLLIALAVVVGYLVHEYRRVSAALLLPKRGIPKEQVADGVARRAIAAALAEFREYEPGHVERQKGRLDGQLGSKKKPKRPHGAYDLDQKREFVRIRVAFAYTLAGQKPPANLVALICGLVTDDEE